MSKLENVFGVTNNIVESYVVRENVDGKFQNALSQNKQIVIYGSSKQGKTYLIKKYIELDSGIFIQCSTKTTLANIYSSILRQSGIKIEVESSKQEITHGEIGGSVKAKIQIPFLTSIEGGVSGKGGKEVSRTIDSKPVDYDLSIVQDISEILQQINFKKFIILDNFHYLQEEVQKQFAFDLRVFQELNIRFIVLGIWKERNRLTQFNGDLQDRIVEIPVEPWIRSDFLKVLEKGSKILNVDFSEVLSELLSSSFNSIGVFQELCAESCLAANVLETNNLVKISKKNFEKAIEEKLTAYSGRHMRSLEVFVTPNTTPRDEKIPLYIPYYFIRILLKYDSDIIAQGLTRQIIQEEISKIHHRSDDITSSDMGSFLHTITQYQVKKEIIPPLFDYDQGIRTLKIIDPTLYFFLRHSTRDDVFSNITSPDERLNPN